MKNVHKQKISSFEDCERAFKNIWLLLERLDIYTGIGSPENVVTAKIGSLYLRQDGGTSTTLYVKESSNERNSGWIAK